MSNKFTLPFNPINWPAVPHDFTGELNLGIYAKETTQRYVYGTRYITWDGRVYKYMGVTTDGVSSYHACCNTLGNFTDWVAAIKSSAGDTSCLITDTALAKDQLAGGMIQIYNTTTAGLGTQHSIVGNEATVGSTTLLYLEFPLPIDITTSERIEVFQNPYSKVQSGNNDFAAWLGVSNIKADTGYKVWVQTWGPAMVSPGNETLDDPIGGERETYFHAHGTIKEIGDLTVGNNQHAGYILNQGTGIAGPQIYLMCST